MENLIANILFLIVGGGFICVGFYIRNSNLRIQENGIKTKAKIINFVSEESKNADGYSNTYYYPIIQFIDKNGIKTTQKLNSSTSPKQINKLIKIIYLKKDNEYKMIINNEFWKTYFPLIFIIVGFLIFGFGIMPLIYRK